MTQGISIVVVFVEKEHSEYLGKIVYNILVNNLNADFELYSHGY